MKPKSNKKLWIVCAVAIGVGVIPLLLVGVLAVCFLIDFISPYSYPGEHVELYTVAVNNMFGSQGYAHNGERSYDPRITVLETDDYGRVLFFYDEGYAGDDNGGYSRAYLIMQQSKDGQVYFYIDDCCLPYFGAEDGLDAPLDALKKQNDWGRPFDASKCAVAAIDTHKPEGRITIQTGSLERAAFSCAQANGYLGTDRDTVKSTRFCSADAYGRELYFAFYMRSDKVGDETVYETGYYAVIVQPDGSVGANAVLDVTDPTGSTERIAEFKQQNGWNEP